jgi:hypothetical protein
LAFSSIVERPQRISGASTRARTVFRISRSRAQAKVGRYSGDSRVPEGGHGESPRPIDEAERDEVLRVERARRNQDDRLEAELRDRYPDEPLATLWDVPTLASMVDVIRNVTRPPRPAPMDRRSGPKTNT